MPIIKAIALDLEGTVVDVEKIHHQAHILSAKDAGVKLTLEDCFRLLPHFIGGPDEKVAEEIAELAGQKGVIIDSNYIHQQKKANYAKLLKTIEIKPRDGFLEFLEKVRSFGLKVSIGSLTNREQALILLERSGIGKLIGYENIVLREDVVNPKPAPDVWYATAKRMKVQPEQQLVFEDSPRGIQGAMIIGASSIGMPVYNRPEIIKALTDAGAKRIFLSWVEIRAEELIKNLETS